MCEWMRGGERWMDGGLREGRERDREGGKNL